MTDMRPPAVILLDLEEGVAASSMPAAEDRAKLVSSVTSLIELAEERSWPCVRVEIELRAGFVDVSPENAYFSGVKKSGRLQSDTPATRPIAELGALLDPIPRVIKRRIGALTGTDLGFVLGGLGTRGLLLSGLVTRGAVLSTACQAADLDFPVAVVADACFDPDHQVHDTLVKHVLPLRGSVTTVAELHETGTPWPG